MYRKITKNPRSQSFVYFILDSRTRTERNAHCFVSFSNKSSSLSPNLFPAWSLQSVFLPLAKKQMHFVFQSRGTEINKGKIEERAIEDKDLHQLKLISHSPLSLRPIEPVERRTFLCVSFVCRENNTTCVVPNAINQNAPSTHRVQSPLRREKTSASRKYGGITIMTGCIQLNPIDVWQKRATRHSWRSCRNE